MDRSLWRAIAAVVAGVLAAALLSGPARAGTYDVYACGGAAGSSQNAFHPLVTGSAHAYHVCPGTNEAGTGIVVKASSGGGATGYGTGAYEIFDAPPGATVQLITFYLAAVRYDAHWQVGVYSYSDESFDLGEMPYGCIHDTGQCGIGSTFYGPVTVPLYNRPHFRIEARCFDHSGCLTIPSGGLIPNRALFSMKDVTVRVKDWSAPYVAPTEGSLWSGGWLSGDRVLGVSNEFDDVGVMVNETYIDGVRVFREDFRDPAWPPGLRCNFTVPKPCPDLPGATSLVDTTSLSDGTHTVRVLATDTAGNRGWADRQIRVDNHAPSRVNASVEGGEGWRPENDFTVRWASASNDASSASDVGSPVARAHYKLCEIADPSNCVTGVKSEGDVHQLSNISVPRVGEYSLRVWLEDQAGNRDVDNASDPVYLRFDNVPPGRAKPDEPNGWLNARESSSYLEPIELGASEFKPVSGIKGFSVAAGGSDPDDTVDVFGGRATYEIKDLPEGVNIVKARAVSGSGVASEKVGVAKIPVDKTPPEISVAGAPDPSAWLRAPAELRFTARDQSGLSGMAPADAGHPVEDGAHVLLRLDGGAPQKTPGAQADLSVGADGQHTVTYQAYDLAGNLSTERSIQLKIDRTAPEVVAFEVRDPSDPLALQVVVSDRTSGIAAGTIEMRSSADDSDWRALPTTYRAGRLLARINDALPDGTYELRARARDVAGNEAIGDRRLDGSRMELRLPLRLVTRLSVATEVETKSCIKARRKKHGRRSRKKCKTRTAYGKGALGNGRSVSGALDTTGGRPVERAVIDVLEQPRTGGRLRHVATVRTDGSGGFTYNVGGGPSRTIRFEYRGTNTIKPSEAEAQVLVPGRTTISVSRRYALNGQSVIFSGKLVGEPSPPGGKLVELQAFFRGRWRTFASARTDDSRIWRYSYRFGATRGLVTYRFRALLRREEAWPYEAGHSRKVKVTVRG